MIDGLKYIVAVDQAKKALPAPKRRLDGLQRDSHEREKPRQPPASVRKVSRVRPLSSVHGLLEYFLLEAEFAKEPTTTGLKNRI